MKFNKLVWPKLQTSLSLCKSRVCPPATLHEVGGRVSGSPGSVPPSTLHEVGGGVSESPESVPPSTPHEVGGRVSGSPGARGGQ